MKTEFKTLSEFGVEAGKINPDRIVFMEEKVKEFIRLVKTKITIFPCKQKSEIWTGMSLDKLNEEIDKLAGKELVDET